ncbi:MAG: ABC transporter permease [Patescibacteria group bacterium]|nr:ABC transporter permease [Patescibacteria group bacterium]
MLKDAIYSLRTLQAAKTRTVLTMLGVIIGVMSVVAVSSVGKSAQDLIMGQITALGTNLINVMPGGSSEDAPPASVMGVITTTLTEKDYRALRKLPHVIAGSPMVSTSAAISYGQKSFITSVNGTSEEMAVLQDAKLEDGRFFGVSDVESYSRVVVLGYKVAADLNPSGSRLIGQSVRIKDVSFQVIGVLAEKGSTLGQGLDKAVFIPSTTVQKSLLGINHINAATVKADSADNIEWLKSEIETTLRRRHHIKDASNDDFSVRSVNQALSILSSVTTAINAFLVLVTAISLLVGGINIMNIMYVAVRERTREIGLRKALGAKPRRILIQFLLESSFIAFTGGIIGLILGALIAYGVGFIAAYYGLAWNYMISGVAVAVSLFVSIGIGLGFGVGPAMAAARLDAIESLRYE